MAVTVTYSLQFVKNLDLAQGPATGNPDAVSLASGGFAVSGDFGADTALEVFTPNAISSGGTAAIDGTSPAIDQLSNGNIAVLTKTIGPILTLTTPAGGPVTSTPVPSIGDVAFQHDVAALSGGGFWVVMYDQSFSNTNEIFVNFGNGSGGFTGGFVATATVNDSAYNPSVTGLDNGHVAVAWKDDINNLTIAVYDPFGGVIKAPALAGTTDLLTQPSLSPTAHGFALAYTDASWGTGGSDITLKQFDFAGTLLRTSNVSNPNLLTLSSKETQPSVARLSNDFLAVAYKATIPPRNRTDPTVFDTHVTVMNPANGKALAFKNVIGGEPVTDEVETPTVTGFANGGVAVFHRNVADNDVDGEHLQLQRFHSGDAAANVITGDALVDNMSGGGGNDILRGGLGNDVLRGGGGNDTINGGKGRDVMFGDIGTDKFVFTSTADSGVTASTRDRIVGFVHLTDKIDLVAIDAKTGTAGNNMFAFRGSLAFTSEGQVRVTQSGLHTVVAVNTTGISGAEMTIQLDNFTATNLTIADFFM